MHLEVEYLIVGAGPAGCHLAWLLRQAECDVLVLEKHDTATKDKLCGGALGVQAIRMIEAQYGAEALQQLALTYPPHLAIWSFDHEAIIDINFATAPRKRLDDLLLARCSQSGAAVYDRFQLTSLDELGHIATGTNLRTGESAHIRYGSLIGADGAASTVRRLLTKRKQRVAKSLEGTVPLALVGTV